MSDKNPFLCDSISVFYLSKDTQIDAAASTKLFKNKDQFLIYDLGYTELQIVYYMMQNLPREKDYMRLPIDTLTTALKKSKPTVIAALSRLVEYDLISRKSKSEYWFNPYIMFKGNRVKFFKEREKIEGEGVYIKNVYQKTFTNEKN